MLQTIFICTSFCREGRSGWGITFLALLSVISLVEGVINYPPLMMKQPPANKEVLFQVGFGPEMNDRPFIINCKAEGKPTPIYTWYKNGKFFNWQIYDERISQQPGKGTLVITSPKEEDAGVYQCFAENELGVATSNSVFVRKSELNSFKNEDPITVSVTEGEPASLRCQPPDGYPKPTVYWMIQDYRGGLRSMNSTRKTVDPEGTLWFSNVTRGDNSNGFIYACSATSTFRNEFKLGNTVFLHVQERVITEVQTTNQPEQQFVSRKNTNILKGKTLQLWCIFSGTPLPIIKWTKKDGILPIDRVDYENYGKTLVIKYVDFDDRGTYECEASNGVGTAQSYTMNVIVDAIPYFTVEPEIQNKAEGETAVFKCEANGKPEPWIYWIYNGRLISDSAVNPNRKITGNTIEIFNLTKADTGNYGCNATNDHGYLYKDVYVNVLALPPEIQVPPTDVQTVEGKTVNMTCRMFGAPRPLISWMRNGQELTGGRYKIAEEGDLIIEDVSFSDKGDYLCHAINKFGSQESHGSLEIKRRTRITDAPQDYEVAAGSTATFRCNAVSDPSLELNIDWKINENKIDFEQEPRFVKQSDNSLSITKTTELDSGLYTCVAYTNLDEAMKSATLIVQDVPNAPQLLTIDCKDKDASITWRAMGDNRAPILGYTIQHNTSFTPDTWEDSLKDFPATSTQISMSPWANYTFRVIARNKIGSSLPSKHSKICTTPDDVPHKNPDGVQGKGSTPNNLVIKWSPMPKIQHNGAGFKYRVYWKRDDIPGAQWQTEEVVDWERDHLEIKGQPTFKPYRIKVEANNEKGAAQVAPAEVIGYSGEDVPLSAPNNLTKINILDATTAILAWEPVTSKSIRGHFMGYKIQTWIEGEEPEKARDIIVENYNDERALIPSFVPNTLNHVRVLVFNEAHDGPPSDTIQLNMPEGTPGPVNSLDAIPFGSSGFLLIWQKPKRPNGVLTGYRIYYQEVQGTSIGQTFERIPTIQDPNRTRAKLAQLKPGTKYRLTVKAQTGAGIGSPFFIERTTRIAGATPPGKPFLIWQHITTKIGSPAIKITWIPNVANPGSHFFAQYKRYGESMFMDTRVESNEDFLVLDGLEPSQAYEVRVVAVDGDFHTVSDIEEIETNPTGVAGIGSPYYIEKTTGSFGVTKPGKPSLLWQHIRTKIGSPAIKITWIPNRDNPGSHFFVQYKRLGENTFISTPAEFNKDFLVLDGLEPSQTYEVRIVAVNGDFQEVSDIEEVEIFPSTNEKDDYVVTSQELSDLFRDWAGVRRIIKNHPDIVGTERRARQFEDEVLGYFRTMQGKRRKRTTLNRFFSKEEKMTKIKLSKSGVPSKASLQGFQLSK